MLDDAVHVILTDELSSDLEAGSMLEGTHKIMRAHDLVVLVEMTALWDVLMHVFNDDWV